MECYIIIKKKGWKSLIRLLKERGKILWNSDLNWEIPHRIEHKPCALDSSLHQGTWSPSRTCVFAYKFEDMIHPTFAHLDSPLLLILFFSFVHTLGTMYDSSLGVWKNKTQSIIIVVSFLSIWLSFDFGLNFIGRLKVMNTWSFNLGILSLLTYFWQHEMLLVSI